MLWKKRQIMLKILLLILLSLVFNLKYSEAAQSENTNINRNCSINDQIDTQSITQTDQINGKTKWAIVCLYSLKKPGKISKRNKMLLRAMKDYVEFHDFTILVFSEDVIPIKLSLEWVKQFEGYAAVKTIDTSIHVYSKYISLFF